MSRTLIDVLAVDPILCCGYSPPLLSSAILSVVKDRLLRFGLPARTLVGMDYTLHLWGRDGQQGLAIVGFGLQVLYLYPRRG